MGNTLLDQIKKEDPADIFQQWIEQNPDLVNRQVLAHNKLFSSNRFTYCERSIKLAVYFRRDPNIQVNNYLRSFEIIQKLVQYHRCVHILPMRILSLKQFDKKQVRYEQNLIVATRQYLHKTLQQRLQSRPPLSQQQKFWFIYQMIFGVYTIHETFNIYHGNIKTSNFLITNFQFLLLTDFASYKPNYILQHSEQGMSEFRLFYSSSVGKCNLAPQKLADKDSLPNNGLNNKLFNFMQEQINETVKPLPVSLDSTLTNIPRKVKKNNFGPDIETQAQINRLKRMDIFSLGLAILQVLNDGQSPMSYEQLLKGQKEGLDFQAKIKETIQKMQSKPHKLIENILLNILQVNPEKRMNITQINHSFQKCIDLEMFLLFWCCISAFNKSSFTSCDLRIHLLYSIINFVETKVKQGEKEYKFVNKPPKCLRNFNSLKIFAEMIEKGLIFAPGVAKLEIFEKIMKHYERNEQKQASNIHSEEPDFQDQDERRKFFINSHKNSKISKRLSFIVQYKPKKQLCPPNFAEIQKIINFKHVPIRLTEIGLKPSRVQELLISYKANQGYRQQKLHYIPFYKNCQVIIKIIFSSIRSCKYVANKLLGIEMIGMIATDCSDQVLLKLVVPLFMNLTQDNDFSVCRQAFLNLINVFYNFRDPFHNEEDIHYFDVIFQFFISIIKQSKLRQFLFSHFKEVYNICEWLELHYKRFNKQSKNNLNKMIQILKTYYGSYTREEVKILLNNNIPDHVLPDMFQFYISLINTERIEGFKLSVFLAQNLTSSKCMHMLDALDSCIESGLDEYNLALFYSIQYFKVRKSISSYIIRKISPHVINPNIWIREQALSFIKMCLDEYPPTKNYFFFRDIFEPPFPLKPEDMSHDVLLPIALKDTDIDLKQRKIRLDKPKLTEQLFNDYLKAMKVTKVDRRRDELQTWNQTRNKAIEVLNFESYIKKSIEQLYENNLLYYIFNMTSKFIYSSDKEKQQNYSELITTLMKVSKFSNDLGSIDYEKKQLFQSFQGTINSSFEKLLAKRNKNNFEIVSEKIKLSESIILIGEVLNKFEMFKINPIPKLGTYVRSPVLQQKIQPKGILISQIFQHNDTITCLEKVADQFFLSGSNDGTLRIFDSKKIMINITTTSQASLQIKADNSEERAKISSIAAFQQTYTAVVGTHRGHIRIIPIERMPTGRSLNRQDEIIKYNVNGQLQKIISFSNQLKNECFCYITAEGILGIQDIRVKSQSMNCNIGRQRGIPRALCSTSRNSILVGTIDGYLINYDLRYNIISSVFQLHSDKEVLPITGIYPTQLQMDQKQQLFSLTYPGKNYEFSCFDILKNKVQFGPEKQYININHDEIIVTPYLQDRTSEQQFKLCRNGLVWRKNYSQLSDFNKNFNIYDYLSDPLTRKESKIREIWLDNCKNRYNQISSLYNKKNLPFIQYIGTNILTNPNPTKLNEKHNEKHTNPFIVLTEKKEGREYVEVDRVLSTKPNNSHKIYTFACEQAEQYYTCCKVLPSMIILGCRNSLVKIYV